MPSPINSLTDEQMAALVAKREATLLEKYVYGKATPKEELEIAHLIEQLPRFKGQGPGATLAAVVNTPAATGPALTLEAPPEAVKRRTGYLHDLKTYAARYGADERTVKRWIADGRNATPPDPCPLDDPRTLPAWWTKRKKHRVPPAILAAAAGVTVDSVECGESRPICNTNDAGAATGSPVSVGTNAVAYAPGAIDLSTIETPEGLALNQAKVFVAATYQKLDAAYREGKDEDIRLWQPRWEKATETLRKAENEDRNAQKHRGDLLPRSDVMADLSQFLQTLKILRASMGKRVLAHLPSLPAEDAANLRRIIEAERDREDAVLRNLQTLKCPGEAADSFALAAA